MIRSQLVKRLLNKNPHLIQKDVEKVKDFRILRSKPHIEKVNRLKEALPRLTQQIDEGEKELEEKNRIWGKRN